MSPRLAARVVDALDEGLPGASAIGIHLYGGEPLTNLAALEAIVTRAKAKRRGRFHFAITTNGTFSSPLAFSLLERGRFRVVLSVDGPARVHDLVRRTAAGAPTHALVLRFLRELRGQTRCWVRGSAVVRSGWSLADATRYLRTLPVDAIKAQAVRVAAGAPHAFGPDERRAYLRDLEAAGRQVIADLEAGRSPRDDRFSARVLQLLARKTRRSFCGAGETAFGIAPDGAVRPCVLIEPGVAELGHVEDPKAGWVRAGARWRAGAGRRPGCASCSALPLCGGGCPAVMPICGDDECELVRKNCEVATSIYEHFRARPAALLALGGIA
jgi:uncharacterized protein